MRTSEQNWAGARRDYAAAGWRRHDRFRMCGRRGTQRGQVPHATGHPHGGPYLKVTILPVPVLSAFRLLPVTVRAMQSKLTQLMQDFPAWEIIYDADPMCWTAERHNGTEIRVLIAFDLDQLRGKIAAAEQESKSADG
jgi:hypothetical protein